MEKSLIFIPNCKNKNTAVILISNDFDLFKDCFEKP